MQPGKELCAWPSPWKDSWEARQESKEAMENFWPQSSPEAVGGNAVLSLRGTRKICFPSIPSLQLQLMMGRPRVLSLLSILPSTGQATISPYNTNAEISNHTPFQKLLCQKANRHIYRKQMALYPEKENICFWTYPSHQQHSTQCWQELCGSNRPWPSPWQRYTMAISSSREKRLTLWIRSVSIFLQTHRVQFLHFCWCFLFFPCQLFLVFSWLTNLILKAEWFLILIGSNSTPYSVRV